MTIDELRNLVRAEPFLPFDLHLADGRSLPVLHREFIAQSPRGRTVVVYQPDGTFNVVDLRLVTDLEVRLPDDAGEDAGS